MSGRNWARSKNEVASARESRDLRLERLARPRRSKPVDDVALEVTWPNGNTHTLPYGGPRSTRAVRLWLKQFSTAPTTVTAIVNGRRIKTFSAVFVTADHTQTSGQPYATADTVNGPPTKP